MPITDIDFHTDNHLVQVSDGVVRIFKDGDTSQAPIEIEALDIARMLKIADEQLDDEERYALGA